MMLLSFVPLNMLDFQGFACRFHIFKTDEDFAVKELEKTLILLFALAQEAIVEVAVFLRVNSNKVSTTLVLKHGLNNYYHLFGGKLKELAQVFFLDPVHMILTFDQLNQFFHD